MKLLTAPPSEKNPELWLKSQKLKKCRYKVVEHLFGTQRHLICIDTQNIILKINVCAGISMFVCVKLC